MGGNAFPGALTRRYQAGEYHALAAPLLARLRADFPSRRIDLLPAYRQKRSFGDMDVLFESDRLHEDLARYVGRTFMPADMHRNGGVLSFVHQQLQIDLIQMPASDYATALAYYAWNDLGNLMGRIAHKMGFLYGHQGLLAVYTENGHQFAKPVISKDTPRIVAFLGYDPERFAAGFDTLEDIFRFAASTEFFNKAIFSYEHRNHTARVRDQKRKTYREFLRWLATTAHPLPQYPWPNLSETGGRVKKPEFMRRAFTFFPDFEPVHRKVMADFQRSRAARSLFNGTMVSALTGLEGVGLGLFIRHLKSTMPADKEDFQQWVVDAGPDGVASWVKAHYADWSSRPRGPIGSDASSNAGFNAEVEATAANPDSADCAAAGSAATGLANS